MKTLSLLLTIFLVFASTELNAQNISKPEIDSLCDEIQQVIGEDWFIVKSNKGFKVYFCRSCFQAYKKSEKKSIIADEFPYWPKYEFFDELNVDSVAYYTTVNAYGAIDSSSDSLYDATMKQFYRARDHLVFDIKFERKWSDEKYTSVFTNNELLREEIEKENLIFSNDGIFSDYRFWLPTKQWEDRTEKFNFYFERLPYSSLIMDYSILITPDKPGYFCEPFYVDRSDPKYYANSLNFLEIERRQTLQTIALVLGIHDYKFVN